MRCRHYGQTVLLKVDAEHERSAAPPSGANWDIARSPHSAGSAPKLTSDCEQEVVDLRKKAPNSVLCTNKLKFQRSASICL